MKITRKLMKLLSLTTIGLLLSTSIFNIAFAQERSKTITKTIVNEEAGPIVLDKLSVRKNMVAKSTLSLTEGQSVRLVTTTTKAGGVLSYNEKTREMSFAPAKEFVGIENISYDICTGEACTRYTQEIEVLDTEARSLMTAKNVSKTLTRAELGEGEISLLSKGSENGGSLSLSKEGNLMYTPREGFVGTDSFSVRVGNKVIDYSVAVVDTVAKVASTTKDRSLSLTRTDLGEGKITLASSSTKNGGSLALNEKTGELQYTPAKGFVGADTFSVMVGERVLNYTVNVQDTEARAVSTLKNASFSVAKADLGEGERSVVSGAKNGEVSFDKEGNMTYTPREGYVGADSFSVKVGDKVLDYTVNVLDTQARSASTLKNTAFSVARADLGEGERSVVSGAKNGEVSFDKEGNMSYTPREGFAGTDTFSVQIGDKVVDYTVNVKDTTSLSAKTVKDTSLTRSFDLAGGERIISVDSTSKEGGTVTWNEKTGEWTYTPKAGFEGKDSFTYEIELDGKRTIVTVDIDVKSDDADQDGIKDIFEKDGDKEVDTDKDGTPDYLDTDSDNDGILDADEGTDDLDKDGIPNYRDADSDGDGLSDDEEIAKGTDPYNRDTDGDGLTDGEEIKRGTDPFDADSDKDGITDKGEIDMGTDPLNLDTDGDGLTDGDEVKIHGTDPKKTDTDDGGKSDLVEVGAGTDPLDASDEGKTGGGNSRSSSNNDSDGDGIPNSEEGDGKKDTDGDGVPDYLDTDSDNDGISDAIEGIQDTDEDDIENYKDTDSDNDGIPDLFDGILDRDGDGLVDYVDPTFDDETIVTLDLSSEDESRIVITDPYVCGMGFYGKVYVTDDLDIADITVTEKLYQDGVLKYMFTPTVDEDGYFKVEVNYTDPSDPMYVEEGSYTVHYHAQHADGYTDEGEYTTDIMEHCSEEAHNSAEIQEIVEEMFEEEEGATEYVEQNKDKYAISDAVPTQEVSADEAINEVLERLQKQANDNLTSEYHDAAGINSIGLPEFLPQTGASL